MRANFGDLLDSILPHFSSYGPDGSLVRSGLIVTPEEIGLPSDSSFTSLDTVVTIDTASAAPGIVASTGVLTSYGATLYMNHDSLYLLQSVDTVDGPQTGVWKFSLDETTGTVTPAAHGQVPGTVLDQFSVDESDGNLRIATTVSNSGGDNWTGVSENDVWVLAQDGSLLELIGGLQNLAHGESIRSVRFLDDRAVITTFPTAGAGFDPVYCIDLSNPTQPQFVGELTLPGFNQYMQFIDDTHVLTVGVNAPSSGSQASSLPLQVSLFDVTDFTHPHLMAQYTLPRFSTSTAQDDHHAFGWFPELGILALPIARSYSEQQDLDGDGYRETTTLVHADEVQYFQIQTTPGGLGPGVRPAGTIDMQAAALRGAFIGNTLYAIGDGQIIASPVANPGTPTGSVSWTVPPVASPINVWPILPELPVLSTDNWVTTAPAAIVVNPPTIDSYVQTARADLAARLHVADESALLVSVEAPPSSAGDTSAVGAKFVLRTTAGDSLYQVASDGTVRLVDANFHFVSDAAISSTVAPNLDVNRDGHVSPLDLLSMLDDMRLHPGVHQVQDSVLRQLSTDAQGTFDLNHDGMVSPADLLLEISALRTTAMTAIAPPAVHALAANTPVAATAVVPAALVATLATDSSSINAIDAVLSTGPTLALTTVTADSTLLSSARNPSPSDSLPVATPLPVQPQPRDTVFAVTDDWTSTALRSLADEDPTIP